MRRSTVGELVFWSALGVALALFWLSAPDGLPWCPPIDNRYWRYLVRMAGGSAVVLSGIAVAVASGFIGAVFNRYLGWRIGLALALVWMFLPWVWKGAISGGCGVVIASAAIGFVWLANAVFLAVSRKARATRKSEAAKSAPSVHAAEVKRTRENRLASRAILGAAVLFALVSMSLHDYRYGEAASAYARLIVEEAGDRVILLNGVCDAQIERECPPSPHFAALSFHDTAPSRSNLVAWVRREWPDETNLWVVAEIGPTAFADAAVKRHPERFYAMMGQSTTPEKWATRWQMMMPYLASGDPFVPAMRRSFAYEGNALGNRLQEKGDRKAAWNLYSRVFTEVEPKNPAACANLNEMIRNGYPVDDSTRQRIESAQSDYAKLLKDRQRAAWFAARIAHFGPVMRDQKAYEEWRRQARMRMEELKKEGVGNTVRIPDLKTLNEWHLEMMRAFQERDIDKSASIARAILSRRTWRGFIPAYMVLGESRMMAGDWVAAEAFLRVAVEATGSAAPSSLVLNDYAETLRMLKRYDAAETYARKAVDKTDPKTGWVCRLTLAQVLRDGMAGRPNADGKTASEIKTLVANVLKHAPKEARERIRREFSQ